MKPIPEIQVDKQKTSYQKQQENPYRPVENKLFFHDLPNFRLKIQIIPKDKYLSYPYFSKK